MKKARKILTMALCAVLLVCISVGATVAYLTANTGMVENTFTVGKVKITLDETDVDMYGVQDGDTPVKNNEYKLIPDHTYTKDPTVHVENGSEQCYVFVMVVDEIASIQDATTVADQMTANGWKLLEENVYYYAAAEDEDGNAILAEEGTVVDARNGQVDLPVFASFKLKSDADVAAFADENGVVDATIKIDAYAIQADGFDSAADAWAVSSADWDS